MSTNNTNSNITATYNLTQTFTDLFEFMINKALILCLTIICICILLLIICIVMYKIIRIRKRNFLSTSSNVSIENQMPTNKFEFNPLHNTSQVNVDINKDTQSLSELRIQNEKQENDNTSETLSNSSHDSSNNDNNEPEIKIKKTKSKKKRKQNSNRSNTESSKEEEVITPKEEINIETELQKQMEVYK